MLVTFNCVSAQQFCVSVLTVWELIQEWSFTICGYTTEDNTVTSVYGFSLPKEKRKNKRTPPDIFQIYIWFP